MDFPWSELDHVIIFCSPDAPEADALTARGFPEGPRNSHPGQGTSNRRFFFRNSYLELLWVDDCAEAQRPEVQRVGLWDRWRRRGEDVCPIGLVFRPGRRRIDEPIESWTYAPSYFPAGFSIEVAPDRPDTEPLLFFLPFARPSVIDAAEPARPARVGAITAAVLRLPQATALSPALAALVGAGVLAVEPARECSLDLHHDADANEVIDLRPTLPLRLVPKEERPAA